MTLEKQNRAIDILLSVLCPCAQNNSRLLTLFAWNSAGTFYVHTKVRTHTQNEKFEELLDHSTNERQRNPAARRFSCFLFHWRKTNVSSPYQQTKPAFQSRSLGIDSI